MSGEGDEDRGFEAAEEAWERAAEERVALSDSEMEHLRREHIREATARRVLARLVAPVTVDGATRWDLASPYLLRHAAEHASEAGQLQHLFQDWEFLVHADPHSVLTFGAHLEAESRSFPGEPYLVRALPVYRASLVEHASAGPEVRRHILAVDAARHQWPEISRSLYHPAHAEPTPWQCRWSTASNISSQLRGALPHDSAVTSVATGMVPGLSYAVTIAQDDRTARVWDLNGSTLLHEVIGHPAPLTAVATVNGPTGPLVVTAGEDGALRCWEPYDGGTLWGVTAHEGAIHGLVMVDSYDGRGVVTCGDDGAVQVRDLETGSARQLFTGVPPQGHMVVGGSGTGGDEVIIVVGEGRIHCLDLDTGTERFQETLGGGEVLAVAAAQIGESPAVVVTYDEGWAQVWDLDTGRVHTTLTGPPSSMVVLAVADNGLESVAVTGGSDGTIRLWDIEGGGPPLRQLKAHFAEITALTCYAAPAARTVHASQHEAGTDSEDLAPPTPSSRHRIRATGGRTRRARLIASLTGHFMLSASADHTMHEWDLASGSPRQTFTAHTVAPRTIQVTEVAGRPVAVSSGQDGTARVWALDDRRARTAGGVTHPLAVSSLGAARVDGRILVATGCDDKHLRVLAGSDGSPKGIHLNGRNEVTAVGLGATREGPVAVVATTDGTLTARRPETGERLWQATSGPVTTLSVGGSRRHPLVLTVNQADDERLHVLSLTTGRPHPCDLNGLTGVAAVATCRIRERPVAATAHRDGTLRLWNLSTGSLRRLLTGTAAPVDLLDVAATSAGPFVAACSEDQLWVWDADTGKLRSCIVVGRTWAMAIGEFDGRPMVATVSPTGNPVRFWDAETGEPTANVPLPAPVGALSLVDGVLVVGYGREVAAFSAYDNPGPWDDEKQPEPPPVAVTADLPELPTGRGGAGRGRLFPWELPVLAYICGQDTPQSLTDLRGAFRAHIRLNHFGRQALKAVMRSLAHKGLIQQSDERGCYVPTPLGRYRVQRAERSKVQPRW
ncbi:WD40 repeat domain-containing protein [Streptomyces chartreusis]|uniref:PQQ-binding-like beta-propeller repeat protein n=1 Tax=Streptomyces chartreusis TaxID=1969 RepID=A0A7H8TFG1_STRCX|nr:PQQ-binding-like beta-propeller repeat protein [Streptomyces chartreusis]QKZ21778.1 PQQ-binding-like beta-propeller repeat protein [Streptomyces chartreusis]